MCTAYHEEKIIQMCLQQAKMAHVDPHVLFPTLKWPFRYLKIQVCECLAVIQVLQ